MIDIKLDRSIPKLMINEIPKIKLGVHANLDTLVALANRRTQVRLEYPEIEKVVNCRKVLEELVQDERPIYGVSTGIGQLANQWIPQADLERLQLNLIRSHSTGLGPRIDPGITKTAMILLANSLAKGHSGIRLESINLLIEFINRDIIPITYSIGSLGASGDLAPLAHIALSLIGEGKVFFKEKEWLTSEILQRENLSPIKPQAKEGLALINGTHFVTAFAVHIRHKSKDILLHACIASTLSLEAIKGTNSAFDIRIANLRKHVGHLVISKLLNSLLDGSNILKSHRNPSSDQKVQDPYSFRCIPQVFGAIYDAIGYLEKTLIIEIDAVTDNPLIFPDTKDVLSGGNFHAEPLGFPIENLNMAMIELANIAERRVNKLVHPSTSELPAFLASDPGVESGFMIVHYTTAAIVNNLRTRAWPAIIDNISVSGDQEDHVSMAMTSAVKTHESLFLVENVIAIEILTAVRGLNLQDREKTSAVLEDVIAIVNQKVPFIKRDHFVQPKMLTIIEELKLNTLLRVLENYSIDLPKSFL